MSFNELSIFFSIIIPVYNVEKYLDECVQSVLSQSFVDYECILVDDGSPDNCPKLCDNYSKTDARIKVTHKENGGLSDARNTGILNAAGDFIVFLDGDDKFADNDTLKNLNSVIQKYKTDVILNVNLLEFTDTGKISFKNKYCKDILLASPKIIIEGFQNTNSYLAGCFFTVKYEYLIKNNLFFKKGLLHEDEHWMPRVLFKTQNIAVNHFPFYAYRTERDSSITANVSSKRLFDLIEIINDLLVWSKDEINYSKEGCAFMCERAKLLYNKVYELNEVIKHQDKISFDIINKKLRKIINILPYNYKGKQLLISKLIGKYNTELFYRLYIKFKNNLKRSIS
jgi:glycosyltransferase involved in cell wall biosynthesis